MKLFITKNPKSLGSIPTFWHEEYKRDPLKFHQPYSLISLRDRKTEELIAVVFTTWNTSYNSHGGQNDWKCSYIQFLKGGYEVINEGDSKASIEEVRLWNKGDAKQWLKAPMYGGTQEKATIVNELKQYVDFYAEKSKHWMFRHLMRQGEDLFYQRWGTNYEERTILGKLEGTHLPTEEPVILYSRRGEEAITAYWDEGDHIMRYHHYQNGMEKRAFISDLYKTFADKADLWKAYDESLKSMEEEEAPACEETPCEPYALPEKPAKRQRRPRRI